MEKFTALIRKNISNPDSDIEFLCSEPGLSRAAFYRKTKDFSLLSPKKYRKTLPAP